MHIIAKIDGKTFKIVLFDGGSTINIILTTVNKNLNIYFSHICSLSLQLKAFNDAFCSIVGSISLPITIGSKLVQTLLHVIEWHIMQYNILLGRPWIKYIQCVPSTYHNCLKYIHEGVAHYVPEDDKPYSHCNTTYLPNDIALPSTHFFYDAYTKKWANDKNYHTSSNILNEK